MSDDTTVGTESDVRKITPEARICPFLTIAGALTPAAIITDKPKPFTAIGCQGVQCALFMPTMDKDGAVTGGGCTLNALTIVMDNHASMIGETLKVLTSRAKITPAPGLLG